MKGAYPVSHAQDSEFHKYPHEASTDVAGQTAIHSLSKILHPDLAAMAPSQMRERLVSETITVLESSPSTR